MLWIKRNLFIAVGGAITLLLWAVGIYYAYDSYTKNKETETALEDKKQQIDQISRKDPFPSPENVATVRGEVQKMEAIIAKMKEHFSPMPFSRVRDKDFTFLLDSTIDGLHRKAEQLSVQLPSKTYAFSFTAQKDKLSFRGGFPALPEQLAEITAISQVLLEAKINRLLNIRRTPVSGDDEAQRTSADYHDLKIITNALTGTLSRPYQFDFECFSSELATILEKLYQSKYALHVKAVAVEPVATSGTPGAPPGATPPPGITPGPGVAPGPGVSSPSGSTPSTFSPVLPGPRAALRGGRPPLPGRAPGTPAAPSTQELRTILSEHLLKVVLVVEVIQPGR